MTPVQTNRTDALEPVLVHGYEEERLLRERTLHTTVTQLDEFIEGFRSSSVTLLDSDCGYASNLLHLMCVRAVSEFDEEVVWIDGGNAVDPYAISSLCKRLRLNKREVLSSVNVSRAFTAYQLVSLINEKLEEQVSRCSPAMVIVSSLTDQFLDKDMKWMESYQLLRRCADDISRVTKDHETITLVSDHTPGYVQPNQRMSAVLYERFDRIVQMRERRGGVMFRLPAEGRAMFFSPAPWNQTTLDEYRGDDHGKDGAYIPLGP
jgi:predicted ATP-dependent serine protease